MQKKLESVRQVGAHPKTAEAVVVKKGRFGPYIQSGQVVANVPRGVTMEDVTLEQAVMLLAEKGKPLKPKPGAAKRKAPVKAAAAKAAAPAKAKAKPATRKKPAAQKAVPKKAVLAKAG